MASNDYKNLPKIITDVPGPESTLLLQRQREMESSTVIYPDSFPIAIKRAENSLIEDLDGNIFIDWVSGISVMNLGFNDKIRDAVKAQLDDIWHALEIPTEVRINFLEALRNSFPPEMRNYKTIFGISGADACGTAINIAHAIRKKNAPTIAFEGAYHGVSGGIIAATAGRKYREAVYSDGFKIIRVPYPYELWYDYDVSDIISIMKKIMDDGEAGYDRPDSVIVEPIQGEGGYIVPPDGFLKAIREFCTEYDLTMIVDEVQSGVGRTGKMWAFEYENITPDIVCVSKSIGGGLPVSLVYYRDDYDKKLPKPFHLGTYRANPLAMAAGITVINEVPKYFDKVKSSGKEMLNKFNKIDSNLIGEVRGKGYMIGIELVDNGKPMNSKRMMELKHELLQNGLLMHTCGHYGNVFRFMGALNMPDELINTGINIFGKVLRGK